MQCVIVSLSLQINLRIANSHPFRKCDVHFQNQTSIPIIRILKRKMMMSLQMFKIVHSRQVAPSTVSRSVEWRRPANIWNFQFTRAQFQTYSPKWNSIVNDQIDITFRRRQELYISPKIFSVITASSPAAPSDTGIYWILPCMNINVMLVSPFYNASNYEFLHNSMMKWYLVDAINARQYIGANKIGIILHMILCLMSNQRKMYSLWTDDDSVDSEASMGLQRRWRRHMGDGRQSICLETVEWVWRRERLSFGGAQQSAMQKIVNALASSKFQSNTIFSKVVS